MSTAIVGARLLREDKASVLRRARAILRQARLGDLDVTIIFVLDREMRALNRHWRRKDKTTDVLSFAAWDGEPMPGEERVLGDLVISVETASRQARAQGHALDVEVAVLVAHGVLHLLGLDHERGEADAALQLQCEMTLLSAAGVDVRAALSARGA